MNWVLIIYVYAGFIAKGDSVSVHSIEGFTSKQTCEEAGAKALPLVNGSTKELRYVCVVKR